ncbi:MAG: hypothetical protein J07HN4v3_00428 [Halonotius sp. J07HN4]|nr:MAG: hypothetical protein J07HN4v3_00428 [Halonotius sp. J07HN4]
MLSEALRVPARGTDATGTLLVGTVLTGATAIAVVGWIALLAVDPRFGAAATPVVFLLGLVVRGYLVRVVAAGINDRSVAPSFVRWGSLLRDGVRSVFVSVMYVLPAAVCLGLAGGAGVATVVDPPGFEGIPQVLAAVAILIGGFGLLCYLLVYLYLRPAARAVLAATGSVRAAVNPRRLITMSLSGPYFTGWLIGMGLLTGGPLLVTPLVALSGLAGFYDQALAAIGGLLTLGVGIILVFWLRMSVAWAAGRGAGPALAAETASVIAPGGPPGASGTATVTIPDRPTEPPATVQVGRGVDAATTIAQRSDGADRSPDVGTPESSAVSTTEQSAISITEAESATDATVDDEADDADDPLWDDIEE